jgi:hypothetical protein
VCCAALVTKSKRGISPHEIRTSKNTKRPWTNLYLSVCENLTKFLRKFRKILKDNYQKIKFSGEKRYTFGQEHTRSNPNWEPIKHFEPYCLKQGLDDFEGYEASQKFASYFCFQKEILFIFTLLTLLQVRIAHEIDLDS